MRRILPFALILLLAAPPAPAALITGQVSGSVTRNLSNIFGTHPPPHAFAVGEPVALIFAYDDEVTGTFQGPVEFSLTTGGGFAWESGPTPVLSALVTDDGTRFRWLLEGHARGFLDLTLEGDVGRLWYYRDLGLGDEGFTADVVRDGPAYCPPPVPEPSGPILACIGAALAGLYGWRRRR